MATATLPKTITVALIGNPNTGKSTLFSALAGVRQRIGNYPGVTVEKKVGHADFAGRRFALVDLPGTYSLAPRSPDEMVTVDVLLGRQADSQAPDAVLCIVDASNLERNLYLVSQVLELGLPTVIALNMVDIAEQRGMKIAVGQLAERLGVPVIEVQANRRRGIDRLKAALVEAIGRRVPPRSSPLPMPVQEEVARLEAYLGKRTTAANGAQGLNGSTRETASELHNGASGDGHISARNGNSHRTPTNGRDAWPRYLVERLLLDTNGYLERSALPSGDARQGDSRQGDSRQRDSRQRDPLYGGRSQAELHAELTAARNRLAEAGCSVTAIEAIARYEWIGRILDSGVSRPRERAANMTDRIDRVLTNKFWGTAVFLLVMLAVFSSIFIAAKPIMDTIDAGNGWLQGRVESWLAPGPLNSLLVKGLMGGVGSVIDFLPQILFLFFFIAVLEDCGYMARAAYLMDKLMVRVGLSGKSFIPLLSSFACAIPGIMATRVIENRRDRLTTILVAPLMSCSARLPVYVLLIGAFIPQRYFLHGALGLQGVTLFAMYLVGPLTAVVVALLLKKTLLRGATPPFVMELPPYKIPSARVVLHRMVERGWAFILRAGTLIVAVAVVVWALLYFPHDPTAMANDLRMHRESLEQQLAAAKVDPAAGDRREFLEQELDRFKDHDEQVKLEDGAYQRQSLLGRMGRSVEPVVRPLGWDWRLGCAAIASFPAREVVLGTLGVIYNLGKDADLDEKETQTQLQRQLRNATWDETGQPVFTVPVALSVMVFFALCAQCAATLVIIKKETNSWRWPVFTFAYMTALAYIGAFATFHIGTWLGG
ncbi:MAG TPA: ferrous iron transport protein B [Pirellulales bacterium]|nr:ferrous iron transport protein B [Pirellulales bacterium]